MSINLDIIGNFLIPVGSLVGRVLDNLIPQFDSSYTGLPDWKPRPVIPLRYVHNQEQYIHALNFLKDSQDSEFILPTTVSSEWKLWEYIGIGRTGSIALYDLVSSFSPATSLAQPPCYVVDANTMKMICAGVPYESIIGTTTARAEVRCEVSGDSKPDM